MKSTIITIIFGIIVLMNSHLLPMFSRLSVLRTLCCFLLLPMLSKLSVIPLDPPTTGVRFSVEDLEEANMRDSVHPNYSKKIRPAAPILHTLVLWRSVWELEWIECSCFAQGCKRIGASDQCPA